MNNKDFFTLCNKYKNKINPLGAVVQCSWETKYKGKFFNSPLWLNAKNPAGIKTLNGWKGSYIDSNTWEENNGVAESSKKTFIKFNSEEDSVIGYVNKINQNYPNSVKNVDNVFGYLAGLLNGQYKWATDSKYLTKLTENLILVAPEILGTEWKTRLATSLVFAINNNRITTEEAFIFKNVLKIDNKKNKYRICIDPGHGLPDSGAKGPTGNLEMDINLIVSNLLKTELENADIEVKLTRTSKNAISKNKAADLAARCKISNDFNANIFISIHCNSSVDKNSNGFEAFTSVIENKSDILCDIVYKYWKKAFPNMNMRSNTVNNKAGKDANFYVIKNVKADAVLVELAFISHIKETSLLASSEFQTLAAKTLKDAILEYLSL